MNQKNCRSCPHIDVNEMSDEMYCKLKDYELIRLKWHKHRPDWCPLVMQKGGKKVESDGKTVMVDRENLHFVARS